MKNTFWIVGEWNTNLVVQHNNVRIEVRGYISENTYENIRRVATPWHTPKEISRHHNYAEARAMQKLIRAARGYK